MKEEKSPRINAAKELVPESSKLSHRSFPCYFNCSVIKATASVYEALT